MVIASNFIPLMDAQPIPEYKPAPDNTHCMVRTTVRCIGESQRQRIDPDVKMRSVSRPCCGFQVFYDTGKILA